MKRFAAVLVVMIACSSFPAALAADQAPAMMWDGLLQCVTVSANRGEFYVSPFNSLRAVFLPHAESNTIYEYDPNSGGKLWAIFSTSDGTELLRYDFYAEELKAPFWLVSAPKCTNLVTGEEIPGGRLEVEAGDYVLDFFLESGRFSTFAFSISQIDGPNMYQPQPHRYADGPWAEWGALHYADAQADRTLRWICYARHKQYEGEVQGRFQVGITRDADGQVVATNRPGTTHELGVQWKRFDMDLVHPSGAMFAASDLLAHDGAYTLTMGFDGKALGTWHFGVAGGQLVRHPLTIRGETEPVHLVEGGLDLWWYSSGGTAVPTPTNGGGTTVPTPATGGGETTAPAAGGATGAPEVIPGASRITINGNTMVPLRSVFEWLGAEVKWIPQALTITAMRGDDDIVMMRLDEDEATVNGQKVPLPQRPVQQDGVTYVPLRFSAEAFGATVGFDAATGAVTITDGGRVGLIP